MVNITPTVSMDHDELL